MHDVSKAKHRLGTGERKARGGCQGKQLSDKDPKFLPPPTPQNKLEPALSFPTLTMPDSNFPPLSTIAKGWSLGPAKVGRSLRPPPQGNPQKKPPEDRGVSSPFLEPAKEPQVDRATGSQGLSYRVRQYFPASMRPLGSEQRERRPRRGPTSCLASKFPGDADPAGPQIPSEQQSYKLQFSPPEKGFG